jgi:hypothetical protein
MADFEIVLRDRSVEIVNGADGYQQEGPMTTFFLADGPSARLDAWADRLASFRSADILMIRRCQPRADIADTSPTLVAVAG